MVSGTTTNAPPHSPSQGLSSLAERRSLKKVELKESIASELSTIASRKGTSCRWSDERVAAMDELCLREGKRCVMWSDEGSGFYLLLNWDWERNRPRTKEEAGVERHGPGYYEVLRETLKPPLLDGSVPPELLGEWLDSNTIRVHRRITAATASGLSK